MSLSEPHVLFVALYHADTFVNTVVRTARHLNASSDVLVHFHAVVNTITPAIPSWCTQWPIAQMPVDAQAHHHNLTRGKPHGASVFLWKPFLYRLVMIERVIVLDLDVVQVGPTGIGGLWKIFDAFDPLQVIGLAREQGPTYARHGRHVGVNGGVQLHHLLRMRPSAGTSTDRAAREYAHGDATYDATVRRCAAGGCAGWDAIEPSLGDQTLYTRLCMREPHLCHVLPCGWNRQLSTKYYSHATFQSDWHSCASSCELLHFNQPLLEGIVPELQLQDALVSCTDCRRGVERLINHTREHPSRNPRFTWGASKQYMGRVIESCCCSGSLNLKRS